MNPRESALNVLIKLDRDGAYVNKALTDELKQKNMSAQDKGLVTEIVMGCVKRRELLDFYIMQFSKVKVRKMSVQVRNILESGAYQIMFLDRIPDSAACNESVRLAKKYASRSSGFVNGVLRNLARGKNDVSQPCRDSGDAEYLSVMYSYPLWVCRMLIEQYGFDECEKIFIEADKPHHPMIRANTLKPQCMTDGKFDSSKFLNLLSAEKIEAEQDSEIENCFVIKSRLDILSSEAYKEGYYTLQNRSSQKAVRILDPQPGEFVIDVCAAPGGKTTAISERMQNRGRVVAFDIYEHKINLINNAAVRLGIDIIEAIQHDAAFLKNEYVHTADRVLVDAPCSGLGVIHTKPDIKRRRAEEDIEELIKIQSRILDISAEYVKSGGILVYSTCTILTGENEAQVEEFLSRHKEFSLISEDKLMTHTSGGSGFYIAKMRRE